jgi:Arc/MetJ family transcription regulator
MKRTNLVLDEQLLEEARRCLGQKTWSEVVNLALRELLRNATFAKVDRCVHSDVWDD